MSGRERADRIKELALHAGFDRAGIARLGPANTAAAYERWIAAGHHAAMGYLARNGALRADPRGLLEGARSILCVALSYAPGTEPDDPPDAADLWHRVARYARGEDYHRFLRSRLKRLARTIESEYPEARTRACVDTAPILEREWGARAGLGAVGKNTQLLHPEGGSWFLLGEVLLTLELPSDEPIADLCGQCSRCLDACPTSALTPFHLQSDRCISYWTIEHRGPFPEGSAEDLSGWVFGCDICQEVCPWNREVPAHTHPELRTPEDRLDLDLVELLRAPEETLRARLGRTPLLRPGVEGLRRNVRAAVGELSAAAVSLEPPAPL